MTVETLVPLLVSAIIGYLFGSIPSGYLAVKAFTGQDVRQIGSGRTGGTNVLRVPGAGRPAFLATIIGDISKGALAVLLARFLFGSLTQPLGIFMLGDCAQLVAGLCAIVGNNWSLFLRGQGGAGVMTATGTLLAIAPWPALALGWLPVIIVRVTRIASIGSLTAAVLGPLWFLLLAYLGYEPFSHFWYMIAIGILLVVVHMPNIQRLRAGRERRIGEPVKKE